MNFIKVILGLVAIGLVVPQCIGPYEKKVTSVKRMPIGLYGVSDPAIFEQIAGLGFDTIVTTATKERLDAAHQHGLSIISSCGISYKSESPVLTMNPELLALDSHPSLASWYVVDEPGLNRIDPAFVEEAANNIRNSGAMKPVSLTSWHTNQVGFYAESADIIMVDRYPIPWMPVSDMGHHVRLGKLAAGPDKPVYAILQAFSWEAYPDMIGEEYIHRPPSFDELKSMTFDAVAQGADGILFFTYKSGTWSLAENPALWVSTQIVVEELRKYEPILTSPRVWVGFEHQYENYAKRFNERGFSAVTTCFFDYQPEQGEVSENGFDPGVYLLAVNTTREPHTFSIQLNKWNDTNRLESVTRMHDGRQLPVENEWLSDDFKPLQVRMYGPLTLR